MSLVGSCYKDALVTLTLYKSFFFSNLSKLNLCVGLFQFKGQWFGWTVLAKTVLALKCVVGSLKSLSANGSQYTVQRPSVSHLFTELHSTENDCNQCHKSLAYVTNI